MKRFSRWLVGAASLLAATGAWAQSGGVYDVFSYALAGGGGRSTGGSYTLAGTAGQVGAGSQTGGPYVLQGGFWQAIAPLLAVGPPEDFKPERFRLLPVAPNPARQSLRFVVDLPSDGRLRVEVFDLAGHRVRAVMDEVRPTGRHTVFWRADDDDGHRVAAGIYFVRVGAGSRTATAKFVLLDPSGGAQ